MPTPARLTALRTAMDAVGCDALIIPSNDPHFSEYVADHWRSLAYISGFDGSAGTGVVTATEALLWTDSRYFLQAEQQLDLSCWTIQRMALPETPTLEGWLALHLPPGSVVGIDGKLCSVAAFRSMQQAMLPVTLRAVADLPGIIWHARPPIPSDSAFLLPESAAGESPDSKLSRLRAYLASVSFHGVYLLSALDDIAWLLNIRGNDIQYSPLVVAYAAIDTSGVHLFVDVRKCQGELLETVGQSGVSISSYESFPSWLSTLSGRWVMLNERRFDIFHYEILQQSGALMRDEPVAWGKVNAMKGLKNPVEMEGFRAAMRKDGVALTRFYIWLEETLLQGRGLTEMDIVRQLEAFRAEQPGYAGPSFHPIVGYRQHGAVVHYHPTEATSIAIDRDGFLLIDSGGQYRYGTTDITRTVHLSVPGRREMEDYTLVLRGVIDLSMAIFPEGLMGLHLDILARQPMLSQRINYLHGTGHGVGHFLYVHEGPHTVRMNANTLPLEPGMTLSNEPALYRKGLYGIRNENVMFVVPDEANEFGRFLRFETLTLCFIDTLPILAELLAPWHIDWLNDYHRRVYHELSPFLDESERRWLAARTAPFAIKE